MSLAFPAPAPISAAIAGSSDRFPVRRIYCVGRNYAAHAREMGSDEREPPFFFTKFPDTLIESGATIPYPPETADYHYEGELVIAIGKATYRVPVESALDHVYGYACGLDMTRRDLQLEAREKGRPWDMGKNFSHSAVLAPISRAGDIGHPVTGALVLTVNGEARQQADLADLIWSCAEIVSHLSRYDRLEPGDLIYTGTPAGVGAVGPGNAIMLTIDGLVTLEIQVTSSKIRNAI